MFEIVLAHAGGIDEMAMFLAPLAFAIGGYFAVVRPLREDGKSDSEGSDS